jgi:hypothetical protein
MSPEVWQLFVTDTRRLAGEADRALVALEGTPSAANVERFFAQLHTLKGTCSMVRGGEGLAQLLHDLEAELATRPAEASARDLAWVPRARAALGRVSAHLDRLDARRQSGAVAPVAAPEGRGWLVRGARGLIWIPLARLHGALEPRAIAGRETVLWQGRWVPVLPQAADSRVALVVDAAQGKVVLPVREVIGPCRRAEAERRGAECEGVSAAAAADPTSAPVAESRAA